MAGRSLRLKHILPRQVGLSATTMTRSRIQRQDITLTRGVRPRNQTFHRRSAFKTDRSDLVDFLREDLDHLFDDKGIDVTKYDDRITFRDPITSYSTIQGYVTNIKFLKTIFQPKFTLHDIKQTGEDEITWTMDMVAAGIDRELVFTGTSRLGVNPQTNRFCSHIDTWDAIRNQEFFSLEAFLHMLGQLTVQRTEALRGEVLLKRNEYEVMRRDGRVVAVALNAEGPWVRALERDGLTYHLERDGTAVLDAFSFPPL